MCPTFEKNCKVFKSPQKLNMVSIRIANHILENSVEIVTVCLWSVPNPNFVPTHLSPPELNRPVSDPKTAVFNVLATSVVKSKCC